MDDPRFRVTVRLHGPKGHKDVEMIVDTGATITMISPSLARDLGITGRFATTKLADGTVRKSSRAKTVVEFGSSKASVAVMITQLTEPLLGITTLEALGLKVDPVARRLEPAYSPQGEAIRPGAGTAGVPTGKAVRRPGSMKLGILVGIMATIIIYDAGLFSDLTQYFSDPSTSALLVFGLIPMAVGVPVGLISRGVVRGLRAGFVSEFLGIILATPLVFLIKGGLPSPPPGLPSWVVWVEVEVG